MLSDRHVSGTARRALPALVLMAVAAAPVLAAPEPSEAVPWWRQTKLRVMWGQWNRARIDKSVNYYEGILPRQLFVNVAEAGGTVFVGNPRYKPLHARYAQDAGLRYFALVNVNELPNLSGGRCWVKQSGEEYWFKCPLDQSIYEKWLVEPYIEGVRDSLIDGIHVDWEYYGGHGEATGLCYCDDCFTTFLANQGIEAGLPEKTARFGWLKERELVQAYEANFHQRRLAMFTRIRKKLQAANPQLLFSSYGTVFSDFTRAMNTAATPFVFLDSRHYWNDDRQPWWESYGAILREQGYLYVPGGWTNALFGAQASQVSAAQWIYEASINEDGCWLWFERELDDEILRAYATADRRIEGVLRQVGDFLFDGERDPQFVTAVEWTGCPALAQAARQTTYHLGGKHLVHVSNVDTEWPLRVRLRFPRLPEDEAWTVRDAMGDVYYARTGDSAVWVKDQLLAGVVVTLEPRSDLFLALAPARATVADAARQIRSRDFDTLPDHAAAASDAGPVKTMVTLYTMKNAVYGEPLDALLAATEPVFKLPVEGWRFKMDEDDVGAGAGWYRPDAPLEGWSDIEIGKFWGSQGGIGAGWYCRDVAFPEWPQDKRVHLYFGAVDENLVLWIDGEYAGDYDRDPNEGWDKPFAIDMTGKLRPGATQHLALRVNNIGAAGGVWKPVTLRVGEAPDEAGGSENTAENVAAGPEGTLVYTATEPMGLAGPEAPLTIANAIRVLETGRETQRRVRQLHGHLWSPRWSPNGEKIVYVHDAGGRGQIFVMNADGSDAVNVSANAFCDRDPVWAPDGQQFAFVSDRTGDWDIWVMNADGNGQTRLAGNPGLDRAPDWSPDGRRLAWESHVSGLPDVWVVNADGSDNRRLIPTETELTVEQGNVGESGVFNFVEQQSVFPGNTFYLKNPVWAPDSTRIAAVALGEGSANMVVVLDADGSRMLQVIKWLPSAAELAWAPDGSEIAGTWQTAPQETERSGIFVVKADGTDEHRFGRWLTDVTPTGPRLGGGQRHGLMSWYSHGSARPRRVLKTFTSLAWAPDGTTLAFSSDIAETGAFYVYTIPAAGGKPHRLEGTKSAWPNQLRWQPQ